LEILADRIVCAGGQVVRARTDVKRRHDLTNLVALGCDRFGSSICSSTMLVLRPSPSSTISKSRIGRRRQY
jgi:hypothetical protein